jgi:hypothetical protein
MRERTAGAALVAACWVLYWFSAYGGVRSPDCEVVFRTAESLALRGTWAVEPLEDWPQFGTAGGVDGRRYSKFGPLPSLVLVPPVWIAAGVAEAGWLDRWDGLPLSHFAGGGWRHLAKGTRPGDARPHVLRFAAAWMNPLLAALGVLAFWRLARRLARDPSHALLAALLFAFATPAWAYAGTYFSEPLAILLSLLALDRLLAGGRWGAGAAGLLAGAAGAAHITAFLSLPPLLYIVIRKERDGEADWRGALKAAGRLLGGAAAWIAALGAFNAMRFGSPFVGGRTTTAEHFFWPWSARFWADLQGLLLSGGKGLLWYGPVLVAALVVWPAFRRRCRWLADGLLFAFLLRLGFIAAYQDWHGGICLGPRYLLMAVPLLLLAVPPWLGEGKGGIRAAWLAAPAAIAVVQQAFFAAGEPFGYYQQLKAEFLRQGIMPTDAQVFLEWRWSPVLHLLEGGTGPWTLRWLGFGPWMSWAILSTLAIGFIYLILKGLRSAAQEQ